MSDRYTSETREKWRTAWDDSVPSYDAAMARFDRWLFRDTRAWVCSRAEGKTLEVAVGTGLNLVHYPPGLTITGIDFSPAMVAAATDRSAELGRTDRMLVGNAEALDFPDDTFDSVVCTFSCCAIPDLQRALEEMARVLKPGGALLLGDHVASSRRTVRLGQALMERFTVPRAGEHFTRRPSGKLPEHGFEIETRERFRFGIVERIVARRVPILMPGRQSDSELGRSSGT